MLRHQKFIILNGNLKPPTPYSVAKSSAKVAVKKRLLEGTKKLGTHLNLFRHMHGAISAQERASDGRETDEEAQALRRPSSIIKEGREDLGGRAMGGKIDQRD